MLTESRKETLLLSIELLAILVLPHVLYLSFVQLHVKNPFLQDLFYSFVCSPLKVQYTPMFCIMGISMYFLKDLYAKAAVFILFSMLSYNSQLSCYFQQTVFFLIFWLPSILDGPRSSIYVAV